MHALDRVEPSPQQIRIRRERRVLAGVLAALLLTTALVSPLAFGDLSFLLLLVVPFALALVITVLLAPLTISAATARNDRELAAALLTARKAAAAQHAIVTPRRDTLPSDEPAELAAAVSMAATHGIHFGCQHLSDADFLQAFHAGDMRAADFRHGDHLRYTVLMLQRVPAGLVEETIAKNLRVFLRQVCGSEMLYHATQTHAWVTLLRAHMRGTPRMTFALLLQQHATELHGNAIGRYYSEDLLQSAEARRRALPPDREPLPPL